MRYLVGVGSLGVGLAVTSLIVNCTGCHEKPKPGPALVDADRFFQAYRYTPQDARYAWDGKPVTIALKAGEYTVYGWGIGRTTGLPGTPPVVEFRSTAPPKDNTAPVTITGTVYGLVRDGRPRGMGLDWYIRVDDCTITARPTSP